MADFNTYDYEFLGKFLSGGSLAYKGESIKRLTVLAQNDKKQFLPNSKNILIALQDLYFQEKEDINILCIFLLSQIILNIISKENQQQIKSKHLKNVIINLGHPTKPQIRKASHTCLLAYIKTYHNFDGLVGEYIEAGFQNDSALVCQKSMNSFQSIFMLESRFYNWKSEQSSKLLQQVLLKIQDQNLQISKASAQCLLSLCRTNGIKDLASSLSIGYLQKLKDFFVNTVSKLSNSQCEITVEDITQMMQRLRKKPKVVEEPKQEEIKQEIKVVEMTTQNNIHQRRLQKIKKAIGNEERKEKQPHINYVKMFNNINHEGSLKERTEAAEDLLYKIQVNKNKPQFEGSSKILLPNIIKMMKDPNPKIVGITLRILELILEDVKESDSQLGSLISIITQKLGDQKISVRQMVAKVIKELIRKTEKGIWIRELLENMRRNTNTFLKDQTLSIIFTIYTQNEVEEVNFPPEELLKKIVVLTDDPKAKIKIRTLDCISQIVFKSKNSQKFIELMKREMSDVIYQMFIEKLQKLNAEKERLMEQEKASKEEEQISYRRTYEDKIRQRKKFDDKVNVSMDVVKQRVSQLKKRNLLSTQETASLDNTQKNERNIQDVEIMLPKLQKKTKSNRFEIRKKFQSSPMKTQNKASDYMSKEDLQPLSEPEKQLRSILSELKHSDWKIQFQTTNMLRRLVEFHPQIISSTSGTNLHVIVLDLLALIQSLRSSVSKNALICLNELIMALGKQIDSEMEIILQKLMKKSADTNVFISSEVQKCLRTLSLCATPSKVLEKLSIYKESKNFAIKDAYINTVLIMESEEKIRSKQYAKMAETLAFFLNEGQQDLRVKAKTGLNDICKNLGDWYRLLRGKISSTSFKLICEMMTKSSSSQQAPTPYKRKTSINSELSTINVETNVKERIEGSRGYKKNFVKISQFPQEFNQMQTYIDMSNSSEWKKRIEAIQNLKKLAIEYPEQFIQYRSSCHFMDILSKQMLEPNLKVSLNAMQTFLKLHDPLRSLIENNLSVLSNSIFNCLSSNKVEIKEMGEKCTNILISQIDIPLILPHLSHGILYSLPKSRIFLVNKLEQLIQPIHKERKQLLFKYVFPLLNKLMDEYKAELMPHVVNLFAHMYDVMGNNMFSHVAKFKEVRQLIAK